MARLSSQSVASTDSASTGWRLVARGLQPTPDRQVAVIETGGSQHESDKGDMDRPSFQLLIRDAEDGTFGTLETKVGAAITALDFFSGVTGSWTYIDIQMQGDRLYLGRDENQRPMYSVNFQALRSRSSG